MRSAASKGSLERQTSLRMLGSTASTVAAWPFRPGEGDLRQIATVDEAAEAPACCAHIPGPGEWGAAGEMCRVRDED